MSGYPTHGERGENWATFAGALLAITLAGVNAMVALLSVGAYPIWSIIILVLDGVVIYALTIYGDALRRTVN